MQTHTLGKPNPNEAECSKTANSLTASAHAPNDTRNRMSPEMPCLIPQPASNTASARPLLRVLHRCASIARRRYPTKSPPSTAARVQREILDQQWESKQAGPNPNVSIQNVEKILPKQPTHRPKRLGARLDLSRPGSSSQ